MTRRKHSFRSRRTPIAVAVALSAPWLGTAQTLPSPAPSASAPLTLGSGSPLDSTPNPFRLSFSLDAQVAGQKEGRLPLFFEADHLEGQPDDTVRATGSVRMRQGNLLLRADEVTHTQATNTARAVGNVRINRRGDFFSGPELTLKLDTLEGEFIRPTYRFARTGAGGQAELVEFLGNNRLRATNATYSSCTPENTAEGAELDWVLSTRRITMDVDANEGRAEGAVVRFMGVPILGAPVLTFPLTDARKSGWLPPSFDIDNKSGFELAEPYYWNIAPNRDATLTPTLSTRRGAGLDAEFRYLEPHDSGTLRAYGLPDDRVAGRSRGLLDLKHQGDLNTEGSPTVTNYELRWRRVSDDDYWKDFPRNLPTLTPRLYDSHAGIERQLSQRNWGLGPSQTTVYGNVQYWQTLKDLDPDADPASRIVAPYRREPQVGVRSRGTWDNNVSWSMLGEFNRFTHEDTDKIQGDRVHAQMTVEKPLGDSRYMLTPRASLRAVSYSLDRPFSNGATSATRLVPTFSVDSGLTLERPTRLFGSDLIQTLEPRALYVYTPYRKQAGLPLFDSAPRDFNEYAIFSENAFTGVDRISDANQVTLGVTSRLIDPLNGAEAMRVAVVQKVLFADQRITPGDDQPNTQRLSDLLLLGSTNVLPNWWLDGQVQASAKGHRNERSLFGVRYSPGAWRTVNLNYRYTRNSSEQVDLGWQWPIAGRRPPLHDTPAQQAVNAGNMLNLDGATTSGGPGCTGTWYSVGRLNYSTRDHRFSDSLLGFEYDAGCWIARVVAERASAGRDSSTRFLFQLELVGLSRLGSSPLRALKDNIPGYRLLREENSVLSGPSSLPNFIDD